MKFQKIIALATVFVPLMLGLGGCASKMIGTREGADKVTVAEASQVASCQSKGKINANVISEVGFITRSAEAVEANLLQMARNSAVDSGGDTVVKGNSMEYGKRSFEIFKCRP
jgi:Domain of unknown function (DUF4156)